MEKETQDRIWAVLSKDERESVRIGYNALLDDSFEKSYFNLTFGHHNLTSDTEPSELLFVERNKVIDKYAEIFWNKASYLDSSPEAMQCQAFLDVLKSLFGDKCKPDTEPSAQGEPKFKVGDKVIHNHENREVGEIAAYWPDEKFCYSVRFGKEYHNMAEHQLEPYTEPKYKKGDMVKSKLDGEIYKIRSGDGFYLLEKEDGTIKDGSVPEQYLEPYGELSFNVGDKCRYKDEEAEILQIDINNPYPYLILPKNRFTTWVDESELEPYTEPETNSPKLSTLDSKLSTQDAKLSTLENDNMEEKELNLYELLKDCIGDTFFHPRYGDVELVKVTENYIELSIVDGGTVNIPAKGCLHPTGMAFLYPDAESMKKYPFDGKVAWSEWVESRTPKRWRAEQNKEFYYFLDSMLIVNDIVDSYDYFCNNRYKDGNYFRTKEEAHQAAEAVRECLMKFQESVAQTK